MRKNQKHDHWGKRLVKVLREKNVSYRTAGSMAGVAPSVIDSWSAGSSPKDFQAVKRLCDVLEVSFTWLLTGSYENEKWRPLIADLFDEEVYFDGLARIRIDRLTPRKGNSD